MAQSKQPELQIMERNARMGTSRMIHNQFQQFSEQTSKKVLPQHQQCDRAVVKQHIGLGKQPKAKEQTFEKKYQQSTNLADPDLKTKEDGENHQIKKKRVL